MKRIALASALALMVLGVGAAQAADPCSVTLTSPVAGAILRGTVTVGWTFSPGSPPGSYCLPGADATVQLRKSPNGNSFDDLGTVSAAGGSFSWDTTTVKDLATYSLRIRVPKVNGSSVFSNVVGVTVDNTAPEAIVNSPLPSPADDVCAAAASDTLESCQTPLLVRASAPDLGYDGSALNGVAYDNLSGVAAVAVTATNDEGTTQLAVTCSSCSAYYTSGTIWSAHIADLPSGLTTFTISTTDRVGNQGEMSATFLLV
ncbi:MAG TPA: hypothetical protein VM841_02790 [Actinomycetota bacterium]|nr:hypothetical protein [Actinomycetota bacterium]